MTSRETLHEWRKLRRRLLIERPWCERCRARASTIVHHIIRVCEDPTLELTVSNLAALCSQCHGEVHRHAGHRRHT